MLKVRAQAPTRIDLAGGTLDLWPIHHLLDRKATVNVGVTLPASVEVTVGDRTPGGVFHLTSQDQGASVSGDFHAVTQNRQLPLLGLLLGALWRADLPALQLVTAARSPAGAGLGGSSCLGVAVAGALLRARRELEPGTPALAGAHWEEDLIRTVQDVEARLIKTPTGVQDYWGGMRGRVNVLTFPFGRVGVETLPPERLAGLDAELTLCYSGKSRASAINNWEIFKRLFDGDLALLGIFNEIGTAAAACGEAVRAGDLAGALARSEEEWRLRTRLWPNIETPETQRIDRAARQAGARFTRVCGAGGGGVMAVFAPADKRRAVAAALTAAGGQVLEAGVAPCGLTVETL